MGKRLSKTTNEDAKVVSLTKHSVNAAVTATDATVKVSGYVANRVGKLTKRCATYLASKVVDPNASGGGGLKKVSGMGVIVDAARGSLVAYGTVYNGLEGNATMTYMNVQSLGAKGLVKKTAKDTGKNIAKNVINKGSVKPELPQSSQ